MKTGKRYGTPIKEVHVVPELCMNFRNCVRIAPGAFMTDPQTRKTRPARWQNVDPELLWRAGWSCPSGAIRFVTEEGYVVPRWDEIARWDTEHHRAAGIQPGEPVDPW
ncbi:MAG TPA: hypothetical protein VNM50_02170 [Chloroflexota bacterium]|nr:hypothetical protein [Chloroflexota bacterium]